MAAQKMAIHPCFEGVERSAESKTDHCQQTEPISVTHVGETGIAMYVYAEPVRVHPEADCPKLGHSKKLFDPWKTRLHWINEIRRSHRLEPLAYLGDSRRGEFELLHVLSIAVNPWYAQVTYMAVTPAGDLGTFSIDSNRLATDVLESRERGVKAAREVCVFPVFRMKVGDSEEKVVVTVREHRPTMLVRPNSQVSAEGRWTTEYPRMYADAGFGTRALAEGRLGATEDDQAVTRVLGRELSPLLLQKIVTVNGYEILQHGSPENTGRSTTCVDLVLVTGTFATGVTWERLRELESDPVAEGRPLWYRFYSLKDVLLRRKELGITDHHSATIQLAVIEHFGFLAL